MCASLSKTMANSVIIYALDACIRARSEP